jgi:crotonobetainyl-CoA:carnitine CoA-transferase CaiB-like acyl-CoA transferase
MASSPINPSNPINPLLQGIRILDLSRLLPGPYCTQTLAQLGAEVIKIEEPNGGDYCRSLSPELFALVNRGKQSITLDLKKPEDVQAFHALVKTADVIIESFRPGVMDKLGCGFETLRQIKPNLVYAALTGYGQTGPFKQRPGHDMNYRGYSGELDQTGKAGDPPAVGNTQVADLSGAQNCTIGILAALWGAKASGVGTLVDVSMLDSTLALQVLPMAHIRSLGHVAERGQDLLSGGVPNYAIYPTQDGHYVAVGSVEYKFFQRLCQLVQRPDLLKLPYGSGEKGQALRAALTDLFQSQPRQHWEDLLAHEDTCVSGIYRLDEVLDHPQIQARQMIETSHGKPALACPLRFSHAQTLAGDSPSLGQHNAVVLGL